MGFWSSEPVCVQWCAIVGEAAGAFDVLLPAA